MPLACSREATKTWAAGSLSRTAWAAATSSGPRTFNAEVRSIRASWQGWGAPGTARARCRGVSAGGDDRLAGDDAVGLELLGEAHGLLDERLDDLRLGH